MLFLSRLLQICCSGGAGVLGSGGGCVFEGFLLAEFGIVLVGSCFCGCCVVAVSGGCVAGDSGGDGDYSGSESNYQLIRSTVQPPVSLPSWSCCVSHRFRFTGLLCKPPSFTHKLVDDNLK
ncbi:hypothetical protein P8452_36311 [Trifolium repens]|nr:hypothetical protein P8452_36311 [Trifolium repens]